MNIRALLCAQLAFAESKQKELAIRRVECLSNGSNEDEWRAGAMLTHGVVAEHGRQRLGRQ